MGSCKSCRPSLRLILFAFISVTVPASLSNAQIVTAPNQWTWAGGDLFLEDGVNCLGVYGTLGVPAPENLPGGREWAASWKDNAGHFWLYGGDGCKSVAASSGWLNDLWKFDPASNEWAWMGGSSDTFNDNPVAGAKGAYGSANSPGGRASATTWTDPAGNLWLFGGFTNAAGWLNDLWKLDPSSAQWAWMGGSFAEPGPSAGSYGTLGVPSDTNIPPGRLNAASWVDAAGHLWLFGGEGLDTETRNDYLLNDLWMFNPSSGQWTWMGGSNKVLPNSGVPGSYGDLGTAASEDFPGSRQKANTWRDTAGNFWLFGGEGIDANGARGELNDLWEFKPSTRLWTWVSGSSTFNCGENVKASCATFGTLGTASPEATPGGRQGAAAWLDKDGNFWLFGGDGYDNLYGPGGDGLSALHEFLNDLWRFDPNTRQWVWMGGSILSILFHTPGFYGTKGIPAPGNVPGGRLYSAAWTDAAGKLWLFGGNGNSGSIQTGGYLNDMWVYQPSPNVPLPTTATPTFVVAFINNQPRVWPDGTTSGSYFLYTLDGTTPTTSSPSVRTSGIAIDSTFTMKMIAVASGCYPSEVASATFTNSPVAAPPAFSVPSGTYTIPQTVTISDTTPGAQIYYTLDGSSPSTRSAIYTGPLTVSTHTTIQAFAGAAGFGFSQVASVSYIMNLPPPSFTVDASPNIINVQSGGKGSVTLTITPQNGFTSPVSFTCSGLPSGASCSFSPATITPAGAAITTTLTVTGQTLSSSARQKTWPYLPTAALALAAGFLRWRPTRRLFVTMCVAVALAALGLLGGCGSSSPGNGCTALQPPPVTSTFTVTASSGPLQQTLTLTLVVNRPQACN